MVCRRAVGRLAHGLLEHTRIPTHTYHCTVGVSDVLATRKWGEMGGNGGKWGEMGGNGGKWGEMGGNGGGWGGMGENGGEWGEMGGNGGKWGEMGGYGELWEIAKNALWGV